MFKQLIYCLEDLNKSKLVHKDLKPDNIMIESESTDLLLSNDPFRVFLIDLGLSRD